MQSAEEQERKRPLDHDDTSDTAEVDPIESLEASMLKVNEEILALKKRREELKTRQEALSPQMVDSSNVRASDIIKMSICGCVLFARRDTLTCVKGSRLEALFSGSWDNQLLKDENGRVFMDFDPDAFKKILEYLYIIKISSNENDGTTTSTSEEIHIFPPRPTLEFAASSQLLEKYIKCFGLALPKNNKQLLLDAKSPPLKKVKVECSNFANQGDQKCIIESVNADLDEVEKFLDAEECFFSAFMDNEKKESNLNMNTNSSDTLGSDAVIEDNDSSTDLITSAHTGRVPSILNLFLNGEIVTVKRSTLCYDSDSKLAQDFSNDAWVNENTVATEDGKVCVLIEQPAFNFKTFLNHMQLKSITKGKVEVTPFMCDNRVDANYMEVMLAHFFPAYNAAVLFYDDYFDDSDIIITDKAVKLKEWLAAANKKSKPKLLFRASMNGWDASDFHRCCDGKGATITVVKTTKGYVFGGYSDVPWVSNGAAYTTSKDAFLFSFKNDAGTDAVRMNVKPAKIGNAIRYYSTYGPTWGSGPDLHIASNANQGNHSYNNFGHTYQFPPGISNPHFLTGERTFQVAEYEVYQV